MATVYVNGPKEMTDDEIELAIAKHEGIVSFKMTKTTLFINFEKEEQALHKEDTIGGDVRHGTKNDRWQQRMGSLRGAWRNRAASGQPSLPLQQPSPARRPARKSVP